MLSGLRMDLPIVIKDGINWNMVEGKAVLLNVDNAVLLQLDEVATKVWLNIDGRKCGLDIADCLTEEFEVAQKQAQKDVRDLLKQLKKDEMIEVNEATTYKARSAT